MGRFRGGFFGGFLVEVPLAESKGHAWHAPQRGADADPDATHQCGNSSGKARCQGVWREDSGADVLQIGLEPAKKKPGLERRRCLDPCGGSLLMWWI